MDELAGDIRLMSAALGQDVATWNEETYTIDVTEIEVARRVAVGVQATDFRFTDSRRLDEHSYEFVFATIRDQRQVTIRLIGCIVSHPGWEPTGSKTVPRPRLPWPTLSSNGPQRIGSCDRRFCPKTRIVEVNPL
jgi:hypothetical protein